MQKLVGAPIPFFLPYVGAAATALLFIPACAAGVNTIRTMLSCRETLDVSPTLRFTMAGIAALMVLAIAAVLLNLPGSTLPLTQFSLSGYGFDILALYGFFSLVMFGATYFIVPRVTRREWLSRRLIKMHFLFSVYGTIFVALVALFGGLQQGVGQEAWKEPWAAAAASAFPYAVTITFAWSLILFSNIFFFLHLTLMWLRLGRRSSHPTLLVSAHGPNPYGEEGDIDNAGPGHANAH
jgi:cytochrome c oxidase cbb3-type subunit 1